MTGNTMEHNFTQRFNEAIKGTKWSYFNFKEEPDDDLF